MARTRGYDPRSTALDLLLRVDEGELLSHLLSVRAEFADQHDAALMERLVKGVLENRSAIDAVLEPLLPRGLASLPAPVQQVLRLGVYQLHYLDRIRPEIAVDSSVELTKRRAVKFAGLVNAVLRKTLRASPPSTAAPPPGADDAPAIAARTSHPEWLVRRWLALLGPAETEAACRWNNTEWPLFIRTNTLRTTPGELRRRLEGEGCRIEPGRFLPEVLIIAALPPDRRLHELTSFTEGLFLVQDESATTIGRLVAPERGEFIADLCAAPGGKTTHLAELMHNTGTVAAFDPVPKRVRLIEENCTRLGVTNVTASVADSRSLTLPRPADRILLDAPCSALGVVGRRADVRWQRQEAEIPELVTLQQELLASAARNLRPGGRLVYCTCTTEREENEGVVERFLAEHPGFELEPLPAWVPTALTTGSYLRIWPHRARMGGIFGAVMRRAP